MSTSDVIDVAAGLAPGDELYEARRFRSKVVAATQASHDAILLLPVLGLSVADRLRVAILVCEAASAPALAQHYRSLLQTALDTAQAPLAALAAMQHFAAALTTDPRRGDQSAIAALRAAGLADAAIVALAQLVAFLAYQIRAVAGLRAMVLGQTPIHGHAPAALGNDAAQRAGADVTQRPGADVTQRPGANTSPSGIIRRNGFTNGSLDWLSWLSPVDLAEATELQQAVLDESHAQARSSQYYRTLVHQPLMLRHRSEAYNAIMYATGGLPRAERELGAMVVSVTNGCVYCTSVHAQRFEQLAKRSDTVVQVFDDPASAGTSERERAIARFAQAVTLRPHDLAAADIAPLRQLGMGNEDIIDLLHAVAIFAWANRLMQNLGEPAPGQSALTA